MPDHATSTDPAVQQQLDRLWSLSPGADILGLDRITTLLARLGDPHLALPPVFHVAGTNGKGSTCAFLRAGLEAAGHDVHVFSSPHLVRFNERIRIAGRLIDDAALASLLSEVLDAAGDGADGIGASFFEVTTAAAFLAFARIPATAAIVEVGLGGRLDATNVIPRPAVTGIAALGMDHEAFLGTRIVDIAGEKAGIAKPGVPLVTMNYPAPCRARVAAVAAAAGAPVVADVEMVAAGITTRPVVCRVKQARGSADRTRSAAAVHLALDEVGPGAVWVVGCAPTALEELIALGPQAAPALVIGLPVGFVGAAESKAALRGSGLPAVSNRSEKGGSAVAAAALNALLYTPSDRLHAAEELP